MKEFNPTHQIVGFMGRSDSIKVMLDDGRAYTKEEWESDDHADFGVVDGEWLFLGKAFNGEVISLKQGKNKKFKATHKVTDSHGFVVEVMLTARGEFPNHPAYTEDEWDSHKAESMLELTENGVWLCRGWEFEGTIEKL